MGTVRDAGGGGKARTAGERSVAAAARIDYAMGMGGGTDWFRILFLLGAMAICAPWAIRVIRTDRRVPHYIAMWLAIGLLLGLIYEFFGPFR